MEPDRNCPQPMGSAAAVSPPRHLQRWVCAALVMLVLVVFGQTVNHGFVNYDDTLYVTGNAAVLKGLTAEGVREAFSGRSLGLWDPPVTLSHMLACQLFGTEPGGHHLFNVLLHACSVVLLFGVLRRMTGSLWRSAFVAAVFAIHPLRAESVAWISERKDVLSGLFFMLTLWSYERYARAPSIARYSAMAVLFACGLACKAMLITLPFVLLLLDYWPLGRLFTTQSGSARRNRLNWRVVTEKVPLLALALAIGLITLSGAHEEAARSAVEMIPLTTRLQEAPLAFAGYLAALFWPFGLAVIYPHPGQAALHWWPVAAAVPVLGSLAVFFLRQKQPQLFVGWFWNLGMLIPVSGLIQISRHWQADHYTYLPQIGLYIALTWGAAALPLPRKNRTAILRGGALAVVGFLLLTAFRQTAFWRDSETLWTHSLSCYPDDALAHNNLGNYLAGTQRDEDAAGHYREALRLDPNYADGHHNLAISLEKSGRRDEAINHYRAALALLPRSGSAHASLASALAKKGQLDEALALYRQALMLAPGDAWIHESFADALTTKARKVPPPAGSGNALRQGAPGEAHIHWAIAESLNGRWNEAAGEYRAAVAASANSGPALVSLAWLLATCPDGSVRNGSEAVDLALKAYNLSHGSNPALLEPLAAAYAEAGRFPEALAAARQGLSIAEAQANPRLAQAMRAAITLFEAGRPIRSAR